MRDVYEEARFNKKNVYKVHGVETHWLSDKEKFLGAVISKKKCLQSSESWKDSLILISSKKVQLPIANS